jgi:hypothetical protein
LALGIHRTAKSCKKGDEGVLLRGETAARSSFLDLTNTSDRLESVSEMSWLYSPCIYGNIGYRISEIMLTFL